MHLADCRDPHPSLVCAWVMDQFIEFFDDEIKDHGTLIAGAGEVLG